METKAKLSETKQEIVDLLGYLEESQAETILDVIRIFASSYYDKHDLAGFIQKMWPDKLTNYDTARPIDYERLITDVYPNYPLGTMVYDYTDKKCFGEVINLNDLFVAALHERIRQPRFENQD